MFFTDTQKRLMSFLKISSRVIAGLLALYSAVYNYFLSGLHLGFGIGEVTTFIIVLFFFIFVIIFALAILEMEIDRYKQTIIAAQTNLEILHNKNKQ